MKSKRNKLTTVIRVIPIVSLILLAAIIVITQIVIYTREFNQQAGKIRNDYIVLQKAMIKHEVDRIIDDINYQRSLSDQRTRDIIKQQVYETYTIIRTIYRQNRSAKNKKEIEHMILDVLRSIRFERKSGYYFAIHLNGLVALNANKPELEGKNLLGLRDSHGRYFIKKMVETAGQSGEGFCEYYWAKPGRKGKDFKKISFVKIFKPFGWLIGTGLYVDDIEARTRNQIMKQLNGIYFGKNKNGYFFANDWNGVSLANGAQPDLIGTNLLENTDSKGKKTTQMLIAASKKENGGYVSYLWRRPSTGRESPKIAYARGVPAWHLFVATGVYLDDIEPHISGLKSLLKQGLWHRIDITVLVTAVLIACFLVLFRLINRGLLNDFYLFVTFFRQAVHGDKKIDRSKIRFEELYQIAGDANTMLKEKTAAQKKLQELAIIAEQAVEGIAVAGFDSRLRFVNKAWARMHGYRTSEELLGRKLDIFHTEEQLEKEVYQFNEEVKRHGYKSGEVGHKRKDNTTFPAWMNVNLLIDDHNNPYAFFAFAEDITERKKTGEALVESERRYQTLFESADTAIFLMKDGVFSDCNQKTLSMFGAERPDIIDHSPWECSPAVQPDGRPSKEKAAEKINAVLEGRPQFFEWQHQKLDGTIFATEVSLNRVDLAAGPHILAIVKDISLRKQTEEEILKLRKLESVGVLAGGIAHDFNNLLTSIFGNIEMAKMLLPPEHRSHAFLEAADRSMENATNLTKQLLTFAKGGEPVKEVLAIGHFIEETAQFALRGSNVRLKTHIAPDLYLVEIDKGQLNQVVTNLVINAQHAMPDGGTITITAENIEISGSRYVLISVRDEGVGIAPQHLDKIFDPYFSTKQKGSGLGLASVYSIIVKHDGTIRVDSVLNRGTTFTINLPATEKQENMTVEETRVPADIVSESARILVMDDEEAVREVLGAMLETMGYEISYAVNGQEAVEKYRRALENNDPYDIVITDLTIPGGMGGQETAAEILQMHSRATVIVSSGYSTDPVMANYKDYGFSGRVGKPYHFTELQAVIRQVQKKMS